MRGIRNEVRESAWAEVFAPERVACVWLPQFALRAERARRADLEARPVVLAGAEGTVSVLRACSPEALAAGMSVGMPAHTVAQRFPGTLVLPFDTAYYGQRYREALAALDAVSPRIEAQPLEVFYLDLTGLPQLHAPERLAAEARRALPPEFPPRIGVAAGKFTAWVAANFASPARPLEIPPEEAAVFLERAPSALLPVDAEMARRLDVLGLRSLGQIARLPRRKLLAQFGWAGERMHRLACGEDRAPLTPTESVPVIRETLAFAANAPTVGHFHLALRRLLERVFARPERAGRGVRQVRLDAMLEDAPPWERTVTLRSPCERAEQAFAELKRRLEGRHPAGALQEISVEVTALAARVERQPRLFPCERESRREKLAYELEQLRARMGDVRVYHIVEVEPWSRIPERKHALLSYDPSTNPDRSR